ncbi:MAG TPA: hypothetical protein VM282_13015 [Acidimicrobiales bacterium]|nr:hypothetical protein [Acidimicrobiales bacterium]
MSIPAGSYITVSVPSANRDPRRIRRARSVRCDAYRQPPCDLRLRRTHCVGAAVARAEVQEVVQVLVSRAELEPLVDAPGWVPFAAARRFESLPVLAHSRNS